MASGGGTVTGKWIVDTDPGVDDAAAIISVVRLGGLELVGLTTVYGNATVECTTRNALTLVELLGASLPVYRGVERPLLAPPPPVPAIHGAGGFGGLDLPTPVVRREEHHAVDFVLDQAFSHPGRVSVLALGPLTNLAVALAKEPSLAARLACIVWMGSTGAPGTSREFNLGADPEAAAMVLSSGIPVTVVPWETAATCLLTGAALHQLQEEGGKLAGTFWRAGRVMAGFVKRHTGREGLVLCDLAAAFAVIEPTTVLREEEATAGTPGGGRVRVVLEVDAGRILQGFLAAVSGKELG